MASSPESTAEKSEDRDTGDVNSQEEIDFEHSRDSENPLNFSSTHKWAITFAVCFVSFVVGTNSTAITSAATSISEEFHVQSEPFDNSFWVVTAWNTAAGICPMLAFPWMEHKGIRINYLVIYVLFTLFIIPQALAQNFATLIVTRVICGAAAGCLQNVPDAIIADLFDGEHARSLPVTLYVFSYLGGVTFGPVFGGLVLLSLSWRWIFWIQLIIYGAFFPIVYFVLPETRAPVILTHKARRINKKHARDAKGKGQPDLTMKELLIEAVIKPVHMLVTEPALAFMTLLSSFAFGLVFISTQSAGAYVYPDTFGFTESQAGIVQVSIFVGEIIGAFACIGQNELYWHSHRVKDVEPGTPIPEARLPLSIFGSFIGLTGGLFFYGWCSSPGLHWILPSVGLGFVGFGIMVVVQAVSNYITDCYASNAASAMAALSLGENVFAAFLPLSTERMYSDLGFHWASSTLGFLAFALSFAPVVLLFTGHRVRERSSRID